MSGIDPVALEGWRRTIGQERVEIETPDAAQLHRYALAVGHAGAEGQPPLAHWAFFLPAPEDAEIGEDGHPRRGGFLPAISLPRRMFAAGAMTFEAPVETSEEARLTSVVGDITHKSGRSGDLVFIEVDRVLTQRGTVRVRERQSYVYRADGPALAMPEPATEIPAGERWEPGAVNLFRFSAATFNGHRIHYDRAYTTEVEGYPSLIIHGPFTAAKLAALAARDGSLASFSFRAQAPLFLGQPVFLQRGEGADEYRAVRCDGVTAMTAKVTR